MANIVVGFEFKCLSGAEGSPTIDSLTIITKVTRSVVMRMAEGPN